MNNLPLVSIITPFFNAQKFFAEAIESVIAQTYKNWELLLVDDGSTDDSPAIAKQYAQQYPDKIRYLEHPNHQNRGKSVSRNLGIANAKGEYIALLDADDVYLPQKLEQQVAILAAHPQAAMVYGATEYWYSWTENPQDTPRDYRASLGVTFDTLYSPPTLVTKYLRDGGIVPCTCGLLVRTLVVKSLGAFEESIQHMYEDQVFIAKICLTAPVFVESGCWDRYRQHPDSSSHIAIRTGEYHPTKANSSERIFLTWLKEFVYQQGIKEQALWKALSKALLRYRHPTLYHILGVIENVYAKVKYKVKQFTELAA